MSCAPEANPGWSIGRLPAKPWSVLEVRGRDADNRGIRTAFLLPFEPIDRLHSSEAPRLVRPGTWRRIARTALAEATPSYDSLQRRSTPTFAILPFQLEPALAVTRGLASRVLIADEVGLGKTIQAGLVIAEILSGGLTRASSSSPRRPSRAVAGRARRTLRTRLDAARLAGDRAHRLFSRRQPVVHPRRRDHLARLHQAARGGARARSRSSGMCWSSTRPMRSPGRPIERRPRRSSRTARARSSF